MFCSCYRGWLYKLFIDSLDQQTSYKKAPKNKGSLVCRDIIEAITKWGQPIIRMVKLSHMRAVFILIDFFKWCRDPWFNIINKNSIITLIVDLWKNIFMWRYNSILKEGGRHKATLIRDFIILYNTKTKK